VSELLLGDCLEVLRTMPDASVDAVVTDPPYGLAFMGKRWDYDVPSVEVWAECLRVLKPGGHLLAFAGTRTQHRMACRIEDAGFEIRDMIAWVYGSGFPKSLDVSKAIDKAAGAEREVVGPSQRHVSGKPEQRTEGLSGTSTFAEVVGMGAFITAPATDAARQWAGWGTALKPALEPITVARKPLSGTVAATVLEHGTGALNVDGCRVATDENPSGARRASAPPIREAGTWANNRRSPVTFAEMRPGETLGRWPANLIHDGSDEVVGLFPAARSSCGGGVDRKARDTCVYSGGWGLHDSSAGQYHDTGSAARFFYTAKASRDDRSNGNTHPTVKPTDLMRYLCRLVTPPGGIVLDPFMGSGSTGKAAMLEGFEFIGIEREASYHAIAEQRIGRAAAAGYQPSLLP
jgi:site-specific DNA-methyltransferase (adenine-specific)